MESIAHKKLFVKLPIEFVNYGWPYLLRPKELAVYLAIKRFENSQLHDAYPSYKTICQIAHVSKSSLRHIIDKLCLFWLISEMKSTRKDPHKYNKYHISQHIYKPTAAQLGELRQVAARIQAKRAKAWKERKQMLPRRYSTRLAHASYGLKPVIAKLIQGIPQNSKPR